MIEYTFKAEKEITCCGRCPLALVDEKLKDNELICNVKLRTEDVASKGYILSADGKYWFLHNRHKDCPLKEVSNHVDWHTGTPTEDGEYVCTIKIYPSEQTNKQPFFQDNLFIIIDGEITNCIIGEKFEIVRWQKIEPYEGTEERKKCVMY